jgi:hypothetical protein
MTAGWPAPVHRVTAIKVLLCAVLCTGLALAMVRYHQMLLGPLDRDLANEWAQQRRHLERLERHVPGAVARISAERTQ